MRSYRVEGIVIKRKNFGEADRILTVYTKHKGKINVLAKGVRKITSKRSSHIELLTHSVLGIYEGKMPLLTETESLYYYSNLKNDLQKAGYAFYICELIDGLCASDQENRGVFTLLQNTLYKLEETDDPKTLITAFEKELLTMLGFWPENRVYLEDSDSFIEEIMEKKIKSKKAFLHFS